MSDPRIDWQPIETCPFASYLELWVTDGKKVSPAIVDRRFGWSVREWEMQEAGTLPAYLEKWSFSDQDAPKNYCSSGPLPDDLIDFIPTHWMHRNWRPNPPHNQGSG